MSALTKTLVVVNLVFSVALAFSGLVSFSHAKHYRDLYQEARADSERLETQGRVNREAWEAARGVLLARNDFLNAAIERERADAAVLSARLGDLERIARGEEARSAGMMAQLENARLELLQAHTERADAARRSSELTTGIQEARDRERMAIDAVEDLEAQRAALQRNLLELDRNFQAQSRDLEQKNLILTHLKERYGDVSIDAAVPRIRGTVMAVDEGTGVVVLNIGSGAQVKPGYEFSVTRGDQYVGRVRVMEVNPEWCGATFVRGMMKEAVRTGDQVATVIE